MLLAAFQLGPATLNAAIVAGAASAQVALPDTVSNPGSRSGKQIRVHNASDKLVFVKFGTDSSVTATTSDIPVPAGAVETFTVGDNITNVAVIALTAPTGGSVYFNRGEGI